MTSTVRARSSYRACAIVARTFSATWWSTALVPRRAQREPRDAATPQPHDAEMQPGGNKPGLVAHHAGHQRRLRIVDDGALVVIDPALPVIDRRPDQRQPQDRKSTRL